MESWDSTRVSACNYPRSFFHPFSLVHRLHTCTHTRLHAQVHATNRRFAQTRLKKFIYINQVRCLPSWVPPSSRQFNSVSLKRGNSTFRYAVRSHTIFLENSFKRLSFAASLNLKIIIKKLNTCFKNLIPSSATPAKKTSFFRHAYFSADNLFSTKYSWGAHTNKEKEQVKKSQLRRTARYLADST